MRVLTPTERHIIGKAVSHKGFMAGGYPCYKDGLTNDFKDIDIWFPSEQVLYSVFKDILAQGYECEFEPFGVSFERVSFNATHFGDEHTITEDFDFNFARRVILALDSRVVSLKLSSSVNPHLRGAQISRSYDRFIKYTERATEQGRREICNDGAEFLKTYRHKFIGLSLSSPRSVTGKYNKPVVQRVLEKLSAIHDNQSATPGTPNHKEISVSVSKNKHHDSCQHKNMKKYDGIQESFMYCVDCNKKESEIQSKNSKPGYAVNTTSIPGSSGLWWDDDVPF